VIDDEARAAYRRRLAEADDDIDEATRLHDTGRLELAQRDRGFLVVELSRAVGLGDRRGATGRSGSRPVPAPGRPPTWRATRAAR
jgi:hypothetical protein